MSQRFLKKPYEIVLSMYDGTVRRQQDRRYRYYFVDGDVPTLVDTCHDETEPRNNLFEGIEEVSVEPKCLVVTHGDEDYVGGFDAIVERYDPETQVPRETDVSTEYSPNHRYQDDDVVTGFEAVHVPDHTDNSYAFIGEDDGVAVLGDTVVGAEIRGLSAGYFVVHGEEFTDDIRAPERNLVKLTEYEFDAGLVFHGSSVLEGTSEKIEAYVDGLTWNW